MKKYMPKKIQLAFLTSCFLLLAYYSYQAGEPPELLPVKGTLKSFEEIQHLNVSTGSQSSTSSACFDPSKSSGWDFYLTLNEHSKKFRIPSWLYKKYFKCTNCLNVTTCQKPDYSRVTEFRSQEKIGGKITLLVDKDEHLAPHQRSSIYSIWTENGVYIGESELEEAYRYKSLYSLILPLIVLLVLLLRLKK